MTRAHSPWVGDVRWRPPRRPSCHQVAGRWEVDDGIDQGPVSRLPGRLGAYTVHSRYDSRELIKPAPKAFESKFEREVDADWVLPIEERLRRAEMARKAQFARLAMLSAKARRQWARCS